MVSSKVTSPEPEERVLITSWLYGPPQLLRLRARPHLLGIPCFYDHFLSASSILGFLYADACHSGSVNFAGSCLLFFGLSIVLNLAALAPVFVALAPGSRKKKKEIMAVFCQWDLALAEDMAVTEN